MTGDFAYPLLFSISPTQKALSGFCAEGETWSPVIPPSVGMRSTPAFDSIMPNA